VHIEHELEWLQVGAAGIEDNAFADEAEVSCRRLGGRAIAQADDTRAVVVIALGDGQEGAATEFLEFPGAKSLELPPVFFGQALGKIGESKDSGLLYAVMADELPAVRVTAARATIDFLRRHGGTMR